MTVWHSLASEQAANELKTDLHSGLDPAEAAKRLISNGPNELTEKRTAPIFMIFLGQFKDAMIMVLLAAAVVSGLMGEISDAIFIMVILILNAALSTSQEIRAEKAVASLKKLSASLATVVRGGKEMKIPARELVPGDLLLLEAGSRAQADARLISSFSLRVDESSLTGESVPVDKNADIISSELSPLADRHGMVYMGCAVVYGRAVAAVTATGMSTELGHIAKMIGEEGDQTTPLQKKFEVFGKWLAYLVIAICAVIFLAGLFKGEPAVSMFLTAVSLAVAAIPEGLPAVVTISLALGAYRMVKRRAIIRKLPAVETLGSITVICSDKTGTLTQNRMTVRDLFAEGKITAVGDRLAPTGETKTLVLASLLCNDSKLTPEGTTGDPTEGALVLLGQKSGMLKDEMEKIYPRVNELPFDSQRKMMTTVHADPEGEYIAFCKGALGSILAASAPAD
ncbi:MAG TPA: HAD-IC family P-type ATPase, partial [Candidatus Omnitrophota bacterium]|nr:HAD-IC family P-type ATPase [Candidatus Omnitrophota bacterium]